MATQNPPLLGRERKREERKADNPDRNMESRCVTKAAET